MRIPIVNSNFLAQKNNYEQKNPSFQRIRKDIILSEKISHVIPLSENGDIITIGKSYESVMLGVKQALKEFSGIIKRVLHINASISVPMAFSMNKDGDFQCVNIGEKPFALVKNLQNPEIPDMHMSVDPRDSAYIEEGDVIVNGKKEIELKDWLRQFAFANDWILDDASLDATLCEIHDYSAIQEDETEKINLNLLEKITDKKTADKDKDLQNSKKITFNNIGGLDSVKDELNRNIVFPIEYPFAYKNVKLNKGILLYGPPGTGKTLLAEALAGECNAHYIKICGSELESKWVGESEEKWRNLFAEAKKNQPSIIFIDEFDSVAKNRTSSMSEHSSKVVNQILALMSDLEKSDDAVFVVAATNKPELFDSAIVRSGRFGKQIEVTPPDKKALSAIFDIHTRNKQLDKNLDKEALLERLFAKKMTGADIKHLVNEAHILSWNRCGIFEKMKNKTLQESDILKATITKEDFDNVMESMKNQQEKNIRKPIGF